MKQLVFATENPGKLREVRVFAGNYGVEVLSPSNAGLKQHQVEETGTTYEENAKLKVKSCLGQEAAKQLVICGDDSGMEIDALGGEPGIHTRRWLGYEMSDDEIIEHTLKSLSGEKNRKVTSKTVLAYSNHGSPIQFVTGELSGRIAEESFDVPNQEGFPFRQLFIVNANPEIPMWKFDELPLSERNGQLSHREKAFLKLFKELGWAK
ncbi:MAG: non-canonical purine NTP pyrophosphatase [Candidatus Saccharibacteria bacterium]|nr:non-canonical purine NTP pyrophosphatase [Candidatus Saccharibacteria bacterium]